MSKTINVAKAEMLIRKPVSEVFDAFINPEITTKFWFTHSSGKLEEGKSVIWTWKMYDLNVPVEVKKIELNKSIVIDWGEGEHRSTASWEFNSINPESTFVIIKNYNFLGSDIEVSNKVIDSTGGFTLVIAGLKAWLEHNIQLRLIDDKFPEEMRNK